MFMVWVMLALISWALVVIGIKLSELDKRLTQLEERQKIAHYNYCELWNFTMDRLLK